MVVENCLSLSTLPVRKSVRVFSSRRKREPDHTHGKESYQVKRKEGRFRKGICGKEGCEGSQGSEGSKRKETKEGKGGKASEGSEGEKGKGS